MEDFPNYEEFLLIEEDGTERKPDLVYVKRDETSAIIENSITRVTFPPSEKYPDGIVFCWLKKGTQVVQESEEGKTGLLPTMPFLVLMGCYNMTNFLNLVHVVS